MNSDEIIDQQTHHSATITFSGEFVKYYFERENKIRQNFKDFQAQKELQTKLAQEEVELRKNYEKKSEEQKKLADEHRQLVANFQIYANLISTVLTKSEYQHELLDKLLHEKQPSQQIGNIGNVKLEKKMSSEMKSRRGRPSLSKNKSVSPSTRQSQETKSSTTITDSSKKKKSRNSLPNTTVVNNLSISSWYKLILILKYLCTFKWIFEMSKKLLAM